MVYVHSYHDNMEVGLPIHKATDSSQGDSKKAAREFSYSAPNKFTGTHLGLYHIRQPFPQIRNKAKLLSTM